MADHQKIYPVEAPPRPPLLPRGSSISDKGNPVQDCSPLVTRTIPLSQSKPRGSSNSDNSNPVQGRSPLFMRTIPLSQSKPPHRSTCCCKCICWTISLLILLLIIIGVTGLILYLVFQPEIPKYSIDSLKISDFRLNFDMSLYAKFDVKITANNPNKKIGIYYEKGSHLSVWYTNTKLCQGSLPKFYQGHQNTTHLNVGLTGQTQYASALMSALQEQQQTGQIPLDLKVDVPVSIKLGKLKLRKVRILGQCVLIVDNLSANNPISIRTSTCKFRMKL